MYHVLSIRYKIFRQFFVIALIIFTTYYLLHTTFPAKAQTMLNDSYIINNQSIDTISNINLTQDDQTKTPSPKSDISEGVNFKVKSGFSDTSLPFSASLSSDLIDFGVLSPTNPIIRTVNLSVTNAPSYGYSILASEDHSLKSDQANIPNTTCDSGECNETNAGLWTNTLTYGFGYRCDNITGIDCDNAFSEPNFYKHLPDASSSQFFKPIMTGVGSQKNEIRISHKINISGNQKQGNYLNTITYIAVPNF